MTPEQKVIKALEICTTQSVCTGCPYEDPGRLLCGMKQDALSVIKDQQNYIENLKRTISQLRGALREEIYHQEDT